MQAWGCFGKLCNDDTHLLWVMVTCTHDEITFQRGYNIAYKLLGGRWDKTAFQEMCNVTYLLLIIEDHNTIFQNNIHVTDLLFIIEDAIRL